jgi:hypothetical protein
MKNDLWLLKNELEKHISAMGLTSNIPKNVEGVSLAEIVNELGLTGKVYYKTEDGKTYVFIKDFSGENRILKEMTYLNTNPQRVQIGLAKVNVKTLFMSGLKLSFWMFGTVKAVEAVKMLREDRKLNTRFFAEFATDIPKRAIFAAVAAATTAGTVAAGIPVAVGVGIAIVASYSTRVVLDHLDKKKGFTERFKDGADEILKKLAGHLNNTSKSPQRFNDWDPQKGLDFEESKRNFLVYLLKGGKWF